MSGNWFIKVFMVPGSFSSSLPVIALEEKAGSTWLRAQLPRKQHPSGKSVRGKSCKKKSWGGGGGGEEEEEAGGGAGGGRGGGGAGGARSSVGPLVVFPRGGGGDLAGRCGCRSWGVGGGEDLTPPLSLSLSVAGSRPRPRSPRARPRSARRFLRCRPTAPPGTPRGLYAGALRDVAAHIWTDKAEPRPRRHNGSSAQWNVGESRKRGRSARGRGTGDRDRGTGGPCTGQKGPGTGYRVKGSGNGA